MKHFSSLLLRSFNRVQKKSDQTMHGELSVAALQRLRELEQENRELKRANAILQNTASFLAQVELERGPK